MAHDTLRERARVAALPWWEEWMVIGTGALWASLSAFQFSAPLFGPRPTGLVSAYVFITVTLIQAMLVISLGKAVIVAVRLSVARPG